MIEYLTRIIVVYIILHAAKIKYLEEEAWTCRRPIWSFHQAPFTLHTL